MRFQSAARTDVGLRRKANEDAYVARPETGFWVVADGMGGESRGDLASSMIVEAFEGLASSRESGEMASAACSALQQVNREIHEIASSGPVPQTIGSTVVGLAIDTRRYHCFWAGDSRAYLLRNRQISRITTDHSLVQDLIRAGMLKPEDAEGHPDSNVITRAVGVSALLRIDEVEGEVRPGDFFLLASDGLTRVVTDEELLGTISSRNPMQAADLLIQTVLERGAPDNVTLIIVRVA